MGRRMAGQSCSNVIQFRLHFLAELFDAADLGDEVGLSMKLQMLPYALSAEQFDALQA